MAFKSFQSKEIQSTKKIGFTSATTKYSGYLKGFLATLKGQTTFSALNINHYYGLRKGLETLTFFAPTNNHCRNLKKGLETRISSAPTNNHCRGFREGLET